MQDGFVKVAAATPQVRVADPVYNAARIVEKMEEAERLAVKLLVLPELCLTGYTCGDLFWSQRLLEGALAGLETVRAHSEGRDLLTVVGLPLSVGGKLYNAAAVVQNGAVLGVVPKTFLPNYGEYYEKRHFSPAPQEGGEVALLGSRVPFGAKLLFACETLPDLKVGVEVCEDLWAPEPPSNGLARAGATVILNLSAGDEVVGKADYRRSLVKNQSGRLLCAYLYACAGQGESTTDMVFSGHNLAAENGTILAEGRLFQDETVSTEVDVARLQWERRRNTTFPAEEREGYRLVPFALSLEETKLTRWVSDRPFIPADRRDRAARCEDILTIQSQGLRKRLEHSRARTAVVGVSGGLDSTLALLVSARAMDLLGRGREDIVAVTMPCFGTTKRTKSNAVLLAERLGATLREIDITESVKSHFRDIGHDLEDHNVVFENAQARERTQVLMDVANETGGLVVGTGDLSELALGWATYNGDHMSMYGVNASVPKTLIRHIVDYEAERTTDPELAAALRDILDTPVSPELLPAKDGEISQKTEELVGPYELHDFFLYYLVRWGFAPRKIFRLARYAFQDQYGEETILRWLRVFVRRFFAQQFKRSCLPDGPKVGSVTLSPRGDWRMPSDASAALWLEDLED